MDKKYYFFIGKGGVGKSTVSSLSAIESAKKEKKTLLISMDPAHNQRDIFKMNFGQEPKKVDDFLDIIEIDEDYWIKKYLNQTEEDIKNTYSYESAFNLSNYFDVFQYSPGIEEYALLLGYENMIEEYKEYDYYLFDMPPTALTMKFFMLPFVSETWLKELLKLRNKILEKKEIITKVKFGEEEVERDKIKNKLTELMDRYKSLEENFQSENTKTDIILNYDMLSFRESKRIKKKLNKKNLEINRLIINKVKNRSNMKEIKKKVKREFEHDCVSIYKYSDIELRGYDNLEKYLDKYGVKRV